MLKALYSSVVALSLLLAVPVASAQDEDVLHPEEAYRYAVAEDDTGKPAVRLRKS